MSGSGGRLAAFRTEYARAVGAYVDDPTESSLRVAYELGREAVSRRLSVLDLTVVHQETVLSALAAISDVEKAQEFTRATGDFFLESLTSFEMVQRGFNEVRQAFRDERRQTELSRQLSAFLSDASLALNASDSLEEMLRLIGEQAREIVGAECCLVTVTLEGNPRTAQAASYPEADGRWPAILRWLDLVAIYQIIRLSGGSVRMAGEQLAALDPFRTADGDCRFQEWLAASLTALDGRDLGAIQLFDKPRGGFAADDEASLVHLARTASAAVERTLLYQGRS